MCNILIKYSFLVVCVSFVLSKAYAMDVDPSKVAAPLPKSQEAMDDQWEIMEEARDKICPLPLSKPLYICSKRADSPLDAIVVGKGSPRSIITDQRTTVRVKGFDLIEVQNYVGIKYKKNNEDKIRRIRYTLLSREILFHEDEDSLEMWTISWDPVTPGRFLWAFNYLIPDFVIDRIMRDHDINDFRVNTESMIACINKQMTEESTAADFRGIAFTELEKVKDPVQRAEITWGLAQNLHDSKNFNRQLIIELCNQINTSDLPFFREAKQMSANLIFTDDSLEKRNIYDCHKKPLIDLLKASSSQGSTPELKAFVKGFINNGILKPEFPETLKPLENLTFSAEFMYELLNIIREQELKLQLIQNQKQ